MSVIPKSLKARSQSFSKLFYRLKQAIGKAFCVFEDLPELFAGIEFVKGVGRKRGRALIIDILFNVFQIRLIPILLAINFQRGTRQEAICSGEWFGDGDEDNTTLRERRRRADA